MIWIPVKGGPKAYSSPALSLPQARHIPFLPVCFSSSVCIPALALIALSKSFLFAFEIFLISLTSLRMYDILVAKAYDAFSTRLRTLPAGR